MKKPLISRAAKVGNLLFLSGMVGQGDDTGAQARDIFEKIRKKSLRKPGPPSTKSLTPQYI